MHPARRSTPLLVAVLAIALGGMVARAGPHEEGGAVGVPGHAPPRWTNARKRQAVRGAHGVPGQWITPGNPLALADTALPRLADLTAEQRTGLERALEHENVSTRVACYAFLQVGTPYRLGPLGEGAPPDSDPVLQFKTTDCTTINLVSAALAHSSDAGEERQAMAIANYRGGVVSYATRFHFTTDRLDSSPYFRDITRRSGGNACRHRTVTLNLRGDGSHWIPIEWTRTREVYYLPRERGAEFERWFDARRIPAALGIAFVTKAGLSDGLDVVHESMLWRGSTLLHASSLSGSVITLPWRRFLAESGARYEGFVLFEYR